MVRLRELSPRRAEASMTRRRLPAKEAAREQVMPVAQAAESRSKKAFGLQRTWVREQARRRQQEQVSAWAKEQDSTAQFRARAARDRAAPARFGGLRSR
jgi:hypothetical protein